MLRSSKNKSAPPPKPEPVLATGAAKLAEVTRLLDTLRKDLDKICMLPHQRDAALEQLKIYGRDPENADPIFTKVGIETLTRHALNSPSFTTSRNALRCIANAMLLKATTRQMFVDLHFEAKLVGRLKNDNRDDEFLISRIVFLTTYNANLDMEAMIDQHHLADTICLNLSRHAKVFEDRMKKEYEKRSKEKDGKKEKAKKDKHKSNTEPDPMEDMALTEILKLLFNITHFCPHRANAFTPAIPSILTLLSRRPANPMQPMDSPIAQLIHGLINLQLEGNEEYLYPKSDPKRYPERMIELLDLATLAYEEKEMEAQLSPLLTLMRKIYSLAPRPVKNHMRHLLLPTEEDRAQPLGKTDTLSSRILRLSTSPVAPTAREELSSLLFEISDKDAKNFVQNVGYGFASGFLFQHNVPIPESATEAWSTSDVGSNRGSISRGSIGSFDRSIYSQDARSSTSSVRKLVERTFSSGRDSGISAGGASTALPIMGERMPGEKSENVVRGPEMAEKRREAGRGAAAPPPTQREKGGERESQRAAKRLVNPITGQYLDRETFDDEKPMTEDEKIREAEKLMVLFERLKKNGVITTEHPMYKMQHEGRFEELSDDADSD